MTTEHTHTHTQGTLSALGALIDKVHAQVLIDERRKRKYDTLGTLQAFAAVAECGDVLITESTLPDFLDDGLLVIQAQAPGTLRQAFISVDFLVRTRLVVIADLDPSNNHDVLFALEMVQTLPYPVAILTQPLNGKQSPGMEQLNRRITYKV